MHLTIKADYCLRVLIYLQKKKGVSKIQEIADMHKISKNHLSVAVNKLSEHGYIISTPGPKGGIEFNPKSVNRTVADLVKTVENIELVECFNQATNNCILTSHCKLRKMLIKATNSFLDELENYKIKDLV